jgi:hypothetical protein
VFTVVSRVHVTQSIVFCVVLSMSLFVVVSKYRFNYIMILNAL